MTMKADQKLLFCLLLFSTTLFSPRFLSATKAAELCNPIDKQALLEIKKSFGNPSDLKTWDPNTNCCSSWSLVSCNSQNRVNMVQLLQSHHVNGPVSPAIGNLTYLELLLFSKLPHLTGPLPHTLTNLKKLTYLQISYTNIGGPIPEFFSQMTSLVVLFLRGNQFTGALPPSLVRLTNLGSLNLDLNRLTGSIPAEYGSFQNSGLYFDLSGNQLTGPIPKSLANGNFSTLILSKNKLTGDASSLFSIKYLSGIDLSRNLLSFDLSNVKFSSSLRDIDISHNKIYGRIAESLTKLTNLQDLDVSYNYLCGQIPTGGSLQNFTETSYSHNKCLCGAPLPACK